MPLLSLLDASLCGRADEPGLEWQGGVLTFGAIEAASNRLAHELSGRGAVPGDRIAVWLPNRPEFISLVLACLKIGVIVVPINILYREREARPILEDARPRPVPSRGGSTR